MGEFIGSSWFHRGDTFDLARLSQMFADYDEDSWEGLDGGLIQYATEDRLFQLQIEHRSGLGFLLQFSEKSLPSLGTIQSLYSLQNKDAISEFDELDEIYYPIGCFLPPECTFEPIKDFIKNPLQPSQRIDWVETSQIEWPER